MTLGIGWIHNGNAYLVSDTAATSERIPRAGTSSFGEIQQNAQGQAVDEAALKIAIINDRCALTLSSLDLDYAGGLMIFLRRNARNFGSLEDALDALEATFGPFQPNRFTEFLFAEVANNGPRLFYWNTSGDRHESDHGSRKIGSLQLDMAISAVDSFIGGVAANTRFEEHFLPCVSSFMQSVGVHYNLIDEGIGGLFFGLRVSARGVDWQPSTAYMLYPPGVRSNPIFEPRRSSMTL